MESHLDQAVVSEVPSCVLDVIFMGSQLSTGAPEGLGLRAVKLSWREHGCLQRRLVPPEPAHKRVVDPEVAFPVLPMTEEIVEVAEQSVDVPVPQMRREIVEVIQPVLVERIKDLEMKITSG